MHVWPLVAGFFHLVNITLPSFIRVVACTRTSFFLVPSYIPRCGCTTVSSPARPLAVVGTVSPFWLVRALLLSPFVHEWTYVSISRGICLGVQLLGHVVTLCLSFLGTARLFSKATAPFCIPSSSVWGFQFLRILADTCHYLSLWLWHPSGCEVVSHCFDMHFPDEVILWYLFYQPKSTALIWYFLMCITASVLYCRIVF